MTDQNPEEYEDVYPLLGAIGPYLSFTTGLSNPVDAPDEVVSDEEDNNDYWEDDEE